MDLLERDPALHELDATLTTATHGGGRIALVSGEAGIGKTALVTRFTETTGATPVLWGTCDALSTPRPLGPLHDIAAHMQPSLARLLASGADRGVLFSTLLAELQTRTAIAVFEDIHWADEATLDLLRFLGRRIGRTLALLVLTYRDDEVGPGHPLRTLLGDLASSSPVVRVPLAPLSEPAVRALVGDRLVDVPELYRQTGGNPFLVTEVLANPTPGVPTTIRDAVLGRVARLSPAAVSVVEAAAIVGARVDPWLLAAMLPETSGAADECIAAGVLVAQADGLAFRHDLTRQAVLDGIAPMRKRRLHGLALEALRRAPQTSGSLTRLADHAVGAADCEALLTYAPLAAVQVAAAGAHRVAGDLLAKALQCATDRPAEERARLLEAYSWECNLVDERTVAISARREAVALWHSVDNRLREGENLARLVPMLIGVGQNAEAEACSREAVALLEPEGAGPELAFACRSQALLRLADRDADEAIDWGERAIDLARRCGDEDVEAMTDMAVGAALMLKDYAAGRARLEERLAAELRVSHAIHVANAFAHLGTRAADLFRLGDAEHYLASGIAYSEAREQDMFTLLMCASRSLILVHLGRWTEARTLASLVAAHTGMSAANRLPALVALGRLHAREGFPAARTTLDEALALALPIGTAETLGLVRAARAERAWLAGDPAGMLEEAQAAYALGVQQRHDWVTGELAFWRWRGGVTDPPPDWIAPAYALQIAGDWRGAADAWRELDCSYERARALADGDAEAQARALQTFDRLGAAPVAARLRQQLRSQGIARVPRGPRSSTLANRFALTGRQVEILRLLAAGLSNAEIATRLSIAPKTAEHHVAAVLAKLDVTSRRAAVEVARTEGLLDAE